MVAYWSCTVLPIRGDLPTLLECMKCEYRRMGDASPFIKVCDQPGTPIQGIRCQIVSVSQIRLGRKRGGKFTWLAFFRIRPGSSTRVRFRTLSGSTASSLYCLRTRIWSGRSKSRRSLIFNFERTSTRFPRWHGPPVQTAPPTSSTVRAGLRRFRDLFSHRTVGLLVRYLYR
jgi:hypothetical protein